MPPNSPSHEGVDTMLDLADPKQSPKADPTRISFLDLARELRDQIYDCALSNENKSILFELHSPESQRIYELLHGDKQTSFVLRQSIDSLVNTTAPKSFSLEGDISVSPALLQTCRKLHHEGALVFYGNRLCFYFNIDLEYFDVALANKIPAAIIPAARTLVTNVAIGVWVYRLAEESVELILKDLKRSFPNLREVILHLEDDEHWFLGVSSYKPDNFSSHNMHNDTAGLQEGFAETVRALLIPNRNIVPRWSRLRLHNHRMDADELARYHNDVLDPVWEGLKG